MRIAYVSQCAVPSAMANSLQVMKMCSAFARRGHVVRLFAARRAPGREPFEFYGIRRDFTLERIPVAPIRGLAGPKFGRDCVKRARAVFEPDLFYTRHIYGLLWALRAGTDVIYEAHALPRRRVHSAVLRWAFRQRNFRHLVVISAALGDDFQRAFPTLSRNRMVVAHDGADLPSDAELSSPVSSIDEDGLSIGYVGSLYPGKGMQVIAELAERLPDMTFHVVGGDAASLDFWRARTRGATNLLFHGFVPPAETSGWIRRFEVVLLPLQKHVGTLPGGGQDIARWTSPLKLFEYMAHGKAIVASDLPVLREVIEPEKNALVVASDDPEVWVGALRRLQNDAELRRRLGTNARAAVERGYTWDRRADIVLAPAPPET